MAQLIQYYVPDKFKTKVKWIPQHDRGKLINFPVEAMHGAASRQAQSYAREGLFGFVTV